jgi:DNA-binding MarR family transcriptional regulator
MSANDPRNHAEIFETIMGLSREIRCCSRDEALCQDVTFHQFVILDAVAATGSLDLAALHGILLVEKSTTTRLLEPLVRRGLLVKDRTAHDSRAARVLLTEEGRQTHRKVRDCLTGFFEKINRSLPEGKQREVLEAVNLFAGAMRKAAAECRCCAEPRKRSES